MCFVVPARQHTAKLIISSVIQYIKIHSVKFTNLFWEFQVIYSDCDVSKTTKMDLGAKNACKSQQANVQVLALNSLYNVMTKLWHARLGAKNIRS